MPSRSSAAAQGNQYELSTHAIQLTTNIHSMIETSPHTMPLDRKGQLVSHSHSQSRMWGVPPALPSLGATAHLGTVGVARARPSFRKSLRCTSAHNCSRSPRVVCHGDSTGSAGRRALGDTAGLRLFSGYSRL